MARYLYLWEIDKTKIPIDPKERGKMWGLLLNVVKQDMEKGITKDWGSFVGETNGFFVAEGDAVEIGLTIQQYVPYVSFKSSPIASINEVDKVIKTLSG